MTIEEGSNPNFRHCVLYTEPSLKCQYTTSYKAENGMKIFDFVIGNKWGSKRISQAQSLSSKQCTRECLNNASCEDCLSSSYLI